MKHLIGCFFLFYMVFCPLRVYSDEKPELIYFYSSGCLDCETLKREFFPDIKKKYSDVLAWREINISEGQENLELAHRLVLEKKRFGTIAPSVFTEGAVLMGYREIRSGLEAAIQQALSSHIGAGPPSDIEHPLPLSSRISLPVIIMAGLIDGVNPCAFAAIAFLISLMHVRSFSRKEILVVSFCYCSAVFMVYTFIGFGAFTAIYSMRYFYRAAFLFRLAIGIFCFVLAGASLYDFTLYKRTGRSEGLILSLPDILRKRISLTIGSKLRNNHSRSLLPLSLGAFSAGAVVSGMEMVCTGQVYLPALVYISRGSSGNLMAFSYILLYNFMFILPLVAVSLLYIRGASSDSAGKFLKTHAGNIKVLMAVIFFTLGLLILSSS